MCHVIYRKSELKVCGVYFSSSTENSSTKTYNQQITETVILARQARPFEIFIKHSSMCENELLSSL